MDVVALQIEGLKIEGSKIESMTSSPSTNQSNQSINHLLQHKKDLLVQTQNKPTCTNIPLTSLAVVFFD